MEYILRTKLRQECRWSVRACTVKTWGVVEEYNGGVDGGVDGGVQTVN